MEEKIKTTRKNKLIELQHRASLLWNRLNLHQAIPHSQPHKFFTTFPYPYMNGALHLGHMFTLTKNDFYIRFKKLKGFNILFPFGFHCTGMPIYAAAERLKEELKFGNPPQFPQELKKKYATEKRDFQYNIMISMGVKQQEIQKFVNPVYWTSYFTPIGIQHLKRLGIHTDFDRSFITTSINPYYDSFIKWQFNKLKEDNKIKFGKRPSIFSIGQKQICADHQRSEGEGVVPQEYILIKLKVLEFKNKLQILKDRNVFMVAATLRPQTMYGQTNIYILPDGTYGSYQMKNGDIFICSERAIKNMSYQLLTKNDFEINSLCDFKGTQLLGVPIKAPLTKYEIIYTLPMMTISMKKGTGIVTSVPSDSPDDYAALTDLKNKQALRTKYNITKEMVDYQPVPIINIPNTQGGDLIAITVCKQLNVTEYNQITSQNMKNELNLAKQKCYQKGFYQGIMSIGQFKGQKVQDAKNLVKNKLIQQGFAVIYYQPQSLVVSRLGQQCIVALCDQWYINYKDKQWKQQVKQFIDKTLKVNSSFLKNQFLTTVDWLNEWGCSRSFGLGSKLPWDQQFLIQSLSDSTIYFAYYTISYLLHSTIDGSQPGILGIKAKDITSDVWDYIFLSKEYVPGNIPQFKLKQMRQEFLYWYPMDLRTSGKDLIKNHLTMSLFNHASIWKNDPSKWPQGFFCNGWVLVEGQKMSKSKGNFKSINDILNEYGADAGRMACAQAGDTIDDANFTFQNANSSVLQLSAFEMWLSKQVFHKVNSFRKNAETKQLIFFDKIFKNEMWNLVQKTQKAYNEMKFRDVIKHGWHQFQHIKDSYLINVGQHGPQYSLIIQFIYLQLRLIYPICPHFAQIAYLDYFLPLVDPKQYPLYLSYCTFPQIKQKIDYDIIRTHQCIKQFLKNMRQTKQKLLHKKKSKKGKKQQQEQPKFTTATIIIGKEYLEWQKVTIEVLKKCQFNQKWQTQTDWRKQILKLIQAKKISQDFRTKMFMFGDFLLVKLYNQKEDVKILGLNAFDDKMPFNQNQIIQLLIPQIRKQTSVKNVNIISYEQAILNNNSKIWKDVIDSVTPGKPQILFQ